MPTDRERRRDGGFTLVEVLVAVALIGTVMTALVPFLVRSLGVVTDQRSRQAAVQLANDGIERARALTVGAAVAGRSQAATTTAWQNAYDQLPSVRPYLAAMKPTWDTLLPSGSTAGASAALPTTGVVARINGVDYTQNWYLGECRQQLGASGSCDDPSAPDPDPALIDVPFLRAVVAVTWMDRTCTAGRCSYLTTTLMTPTIDPESPVVDDLGAQTSYALVAINPVQLTVTGGASPLVWSFTGLPAGLNGSTTGLVSGIPADPGNDTTYPVLVKVTDRLGRTDTITISWTVIAAPVVANPGNQVTRTGTDVSLPMTVTKAVGAVQWTATGLPAGLAINAGTGLISGRPTASTGAPVSSVTVTATDAPGRSSSVTFTWKIKTLLIQPVATRSDAMRANVKFTPVVTGGTGPYTFRVVDYPGEEDGAVKIDSKTGEISGKVKHGDRYLTTIYVTDASGDEVKTTFIWYVEPDHPNDLTIIFPDPKNPDRTNKVGDTVNLRTEALYGSMSGYNWSATGLPPGLTMGPTVDTYYGPITGKPTTAGVYRVKLFVWDSNNKYSTVMFDWTVTP